MAAALKAFKRIDILFNSAGIMFPTSILDTTVEQWDRTLDVNLRGHFLCLQAVGRGMVAQGSGKIINISSVLGIQGRVQRAAYGVSKAGIIMLTKTAALEFGPHGVCVNAIAPGSIKTPFVTTAPATPRRTSAKWLSFRCVAGARQMISLGRRCFWRRARRIMSAAPC